jgi:hypothetical protein
MAISIVLFIAAGLRKLVEDIWYGCGSENQNRYGMELWAALSL